MDKAINRSKKELLFVPVKELSDKAKSKLVKYKEAKDASLAKLRQDFDAGKFD
jgi:hypothetical protein